MAIQGTSGYSVLLHYPTSETSLVDVTGVAVVRTRNQLSDSTTVLAGRENGTLARFSILQVNDEEPHQSKMTEVYTVSLVRAWVPIKYLTSSGSTV